MYGRDGTGRDRVKRGMAEWRGVKKYIYHSLRKNTRTLISVGVSRAGERAQKSPCARRGDALGGGKGRFSFVRKNWTLC